jgi:catechol 2,3-dioxygenase-like lactoylglutathione lyase family enzyme
MLERIDHVNIVVADMPTMIAFYRDLLGMRVTREATISGDWIDQVTGLNKVVADVAFLEMPEGPSIELLKYQSPNGFRPDDLGRSNTQGLRHIALRVRAIDEWVERLQAADIKLQSAIFRVPAMQVEYTAAQKRLVYFHDPEGNLLELCSYE